MHDRPPVGDVTIRHQPGDGVHARNAGSIFHDDNEAVLDDLTICTLDGQEILRGEDGEGKESETNERVDRSHRGEQWPYLSLNE